jgi:hypothetical protein
MVGPAIPDPPVSTLLHARQIRAIAANRLRQSAHRPVDVTPVTRLPIPGIDE